MDAAQRRAIESTAASYLHRHEVRPRQQAPYSGPGMAPTHTPAPGWQQYSAAANFAAQPLMAVESAQTAPAVLQKYWDPARHYAPRDSVIELTPTQQYENRRIGWETNQRALQAAPALMQGVQQLEQDARLRDAQYEMNYRQLSGIVAVANQWQATNDRCQQIHEHWVRLCQEVWKDLERYEAQLGYDIAAWDWRQEQDRRRLEAQVQAQAALQDGEFLFVAATASEGEGAQGSVDEEETNAR